MQRGPRSPPPLKTPCHLERSQGWLPASLENRTPSQKPNTQSMAQSRLNRQKNSILSAVLPPVHPAARTTSPHTARVAQKQTREAKAAQSRAIWIITPSTSFVRPPDNVSLLFYLQALFVLRLPARKKPRGTLAFRLCSCVFRRTEPEPSRPSRDGSGLAGRGDFCAVPRFWCGARTAPPFRRPAT